MPDDDILQRLGIKKETVKKWDELESEEMFSRSLGESKSISESLEAMPGLELALVEASVATSIDSDQINSKELYKFKTMMELLNYPNGIAINRLQAKIQCSVQSLKRIVRSRFIIKIQVTGNTMKRDTAHRNKVRNPSGIRIPYGFNQQMNGISNFAQEHLRSYVSHLQTNLLSKKKNTNRRTSRFSTISHD